MTVEITTDDGVFNPAAVPAGAQIEETDGDTWIWTGKTFQGQHLICRPEQGIFSGWYRLLTTEQLTNYTYLSLRDEVGATTLQWMYKAAQADVMRLEEMTCSREQRADWELLNEAMNEYADSKGLCGEYEKQLDEWNDSFARLSLTGRNKTYEVELTITATFTTTVEVEATSDDDASEKAGDMDWDEVTRNIDLSDASDMNWDVENVTAQ